MRLYCSCADKFPIRLVDITELFMRELAARGVEQAWFCKPSAAAGPLRRETIHGIVVTVPPTIVAGGVIGQIVTRLGYWFFDTCFLLQQLALRPDAILVRDKYWAAFVAWCVTRLTKAKLMIWLSYPYPEHDTEEAGDVSGFRRQLKRLRAWIGYRLLYGFVMSRADICFVQSEQMKQDLLRWRIPAERMTPVPMGIARKVFDEIDTTVAPSDPPVVLYLGTLAAVRRLEILVDAFALVARRRPDVRFQFVGDGDVPEERRMLEERVGSAGLADVIEFTGQLPMTQAWDRVARASVCVSPFRMTPVLRVASPTKFIEYLAFAKPTVGNTHPEHSMIAAASRGALTVEWSAQAFADAIVWCLEHPEEAARMAERGRRWVGEHRTYDRLGALVFSELERIVRT